MDVNLTSVPHCLGVDHDDHRVIFISPRVVHILLSQTDDNHLEPHPWQFFATFLAKSRNILSGTGIAEAGA